VVDRCRDETDRTAPTLNEANELAAWTASLFLVVPVPTVISLSLFRRRRHWAVPIRLAVYLLGVGRGDPIHVAGQIERSTRLGGLLSDSRHIRVAA
jgi:hypothetical protein